MMNPTLEEKLKHLPDKPGVYMMKDLRGQVIYVGKAVSLRARVRSYFHKGQAQLAKVLVMVSKVTDVDWLTTDTELEALMLECNLIKQYRPRYNVRLRDDKHYPYLCITTSEPFPRITVTRRVKQDGNRYFGPYGNSTAMRESQHLIQKLFRIRGCSKKLVGAEHDRPCLNFHMNQCEAPCSGRINREKYGELVSNVCLFLEGKVEVLVRKLHEDMCRLAEALQFERAARLRDQLQALRTLVERQKVISTDLVDRDIVAIASLEGTTCAFVLFVRSGKLIGEEHFFLEGVMDESLGSSLGEFLKQYYRDAGYIPREILISEEIPEVNILEEWLSGKVGARVKVISPKRGDKRRLVAMAAQNAELTVRRDIEREGEISQRTASELESLRVALGLDALPMRIEAYDISNIQGCEAVGSMVVFENGQATKSQYRRFKIRTLEQPDDCAMIREVLLRRFARMGESKFAKMPDLVLIDGGRGQLSAAQEVISTVVAEGNIIIVALAKRLEEIFLVSSPNPLLLPRDSEALQLLQRIRDEAHRFAISYHRKLRDRKAKKSELDDIPGIGNKRRAALIRRFGSVAGVRKASLEELLSVPGITRTVAESIYEYFHS